MTLNCRLPNVVLPVARPLGSNSVLVPMDTWDNSASPVLLAIVIHPHVVDLSRDASLATATNTLKFAILKLDAASANTTQPETLAINVLRATTVTLSTAPHTIANVALAQTMAPACKCKTVQ